MYVQEIELFPDRRWISDSFHLLFLWMIYFGYSSIESRRSVYFQSYNFSNTINKRWLFNGSGKARSPLSTLVDEVVKRISDPESC